MPDEEEQPTPAQGAVPTTGGAPVQLSPTSGIVGAGSAGGTGGAPAPKSPASQPAGGAFGSLNQYLTANQGQAAPLAGKITPGINQEYNNLNAADNATIAGINNQVTNTPGYVSGSTAAPTLSAEAANPASFTNTPSNVTSFQGLLNDTYGGPTSAEGTSNYANQQAAINSAIAAGTASTTTEAGRENLLSQNEATPTTGVTALNSAILSQDPNALASIEKAYQPFNNLLTNLNTGAQGVDTTISKEQADAASTAQAANQQIANQIDTLNTNVSGELAAAQQKAAAQNAQIKADLAAGTPSASDLQALGMTQAQWNTLSAADKAAATSQTVKSGNGQFGATTGTTTIDPTQFLTQQDPNAVFNAANVATPQDYANAQAFQTLLQGMNLQTPTALINPSTSGEAGTAPTNLNQFNYQTGLNTATSAEADEVAAAQAYVNALQSGADEQHAQLAAQTAGRQKEEQVGEALTGVGLPLAIASNIPVIGKPIAQAVDSVVQAVTHPSWICTAMRNAGIMTQEEVNRLHDHVYRAFWHKPIAFLGYILAGSFVVAFAEAAGIEWGHWKPVFYNAIMAVENPIIAAEKYEAGFWALARATWIKLQVKYGY